MRKIDPAMWEEYEARMLEMWPKSPGMVKYCLDKVSNIVRLSSGRLVVLDKPRIETDFCFGESGYDADEAHRMCRVALTKESYFLRENLKDFDDWIEALEHREWSAVEGCSEPYIWVFETDWEACPRYGRWYEYERAKEVSRDGTVRRLDYEDRKILLDAYREERAKFEKRLKTYLKRYGLSKIRSWTYWRDA